MQAEVQRLIEAKTKGHRRCGSVGGPRTTAPGTPHARRFGGRSEGSTRAATRVLEQCLRKGALRSNEVFRRPTVQRVSTQGIGEDPEMEVSDRRGWVRHQLNLSHFRMRI